MPDEIEVLDRTLARLSEALAASASERATADAAARARVDAARSALRAAELRALKESRDVDRIHSSGVARAVASLRGKLEAEITREEAEAKAAWEAKAEAAGELEAALAELRALREEVARQEKVIDQIRWRKIDLLERRSPSHAELRRVGEERASGRTKVLAWRLALRAWGDLRRKVTSGALNAMVAHPFHEAIEHPYDTERDVAFERYSESLLADVPGLAEVDRAFDTAGLPRVEIPIDEIDTARNSLAALLGDALVDMVVHGAAVRRMQKKLDAALAMAREQLAAEEQRLAALEERWSKV